MQKKVFYMGVPYEPENLELLGSGAEGSVYYIEPLNLAMKLYHGWNLYDTDYKDLTEEQKNQLNKLYQVGRKLMEFPHSLPERIAKPVGLVLDEKRHRIVGFCMPFIKGFTLSMFERKSFRRKFSKDFGSLNGTVKALIELHTLVRSLHERDVLVVDFAPDNVIYQQNGQFLVIYFCDADSMSWGRFKGDGFHWQTVDPKIIKKSIGSVCLSGQFSKESDWYSFTVITMSTLTTINPYDGPPQAKWANLPQIQRPTERLSVFHPDVEYPAGGIPLDFFPKELSRYWEDTIYGNKRGEFPVRLLTTLSWKKCPKCKADYASDRCPVCH